MVYHLHKWAWNSLDWLFPPICGGCGKPGTRWCADCCQNTRQVHLPVCDLCGQMQPTPGVCVECRSDPPSYLALRSWGIYQGPLRSAIHRLKFKGDLALGEILARGVIQLLDQQRWSLDVVVPVPSGIARQKQRGYNQAALLARPVAFWFGIPYQAAALKKVRETRSQVGLSLQERYENVASAFQATGSIVAGKSVLVIDDVCTSGATMKACAQALTAAGARKVYGLTLARTTHPTGLDDHG